MPDNQRQRNMKICNGHKCCPADQECAHKVPHDFSGMFSDYCNQPERCVTINALTICVGINE